MYERSVVEEHITLIKEPQSEYIGHFAASTGSSQSLFNVFDFVFRFPSFIHTMIFICVILFNIKRYSIMISLSKLIFLRNHGLFYSNYGDCKNALNKNNNVIL